MSSALRRDNPEMLGRIVELVATKGVSNAAICRDVGISQTTLKRWIKEKPEFAKSIAQAKCKQFEDLIDQALKALCKRVNGYSIVEKKTTYVADKEGNSVVKEICEVVKDVAPDLAAIIFTLTNRDYDNWQQKPLPSQISEQQNHDVDMSKLSASTLHELQEFYKNYETNDI